jgi:phosphonate metabolism-associated iron-containing alcohol dehydrogenase
MSGGRHPAGSPATAVSEAFPEAVAGAVPDALPDALPWSVHNPVSVHFGCGALDARLGELVGARRALLLLYPEAIGGPLHERLTILLGDRCAGVMAAPAANPDLESLESLHTALWSSDHGASCLVAVGGGSTIDTAKGLALGTPAGGFAALRTHLREGTAFEPSARLALIAVPTTAGTGSEVTPWATLWDRSSAKGVKRSLHRADTWPEAALIDPLLTQSCPPSLTLASGLDALSHALEAIWNRGANPYSDALAVQAARGVLMTLPALLAAPQSLPLREAMSRAALLAGLAFAQTRTALAHALSYDVTLLRGTPHGLACSFSLPEVWRRAQGRSPERDSVLAQVSSGIVSNDPGTKSIDAPQWLEGWLGALGVSTRFADYGLDDPDAAIRAVLDSPRGRNFIGADL